MDELTNEKAARALEEQGHLFQERCMFDITHKVSALAFKSKEYPVSVGETQTSVDFIFRAKNHQPRFMYFVFECKRANPKYSNWLFSRSVPLAAVNRSLLVTKLTTNNAKHAFTLPVRVSSHELRSELKYDDFVDPYGVEVRDKKEGDPTKSIFGACQQVLTGIAGLVTEEKQRLEDGKVASFESLYIPIVLTTANLFRTEFRARDVDISTGRINADKTKTIPVKWIVIDFPTTGPLQVTLPEGVLSDEGPTDEYREKFKVKSVAIVKAEAIKEFFERIFPLS
ncbi:MAG: hypothetical protein ACYDBL_02360 [Candidatus Acidiferrales bacterium]